MFLIFVSLCTFPLFSPSPLPQFFYFLYYKHNNVPNVPVGILFSLLFYLCHAPISQPLNPDHTFGIDLLLLSSVSQQEASSRVRFSQKGEFDPILVNLLIVVLHFFHLLSLSVDVKSDKIGHKLVTSWWYNL